MKIVSTAVLAALLATAVALAGIGRPAPARSAAAAVARTLTVTGSGTARGVPDTAVFSFGVETEGATARSAAAANAERMRRVIAALVDAGVARSDLQTQEVSVYPRRDDSRASGGFTASGSLSATVRDLARAGEAVDAAVAAGGNQVSGPQFQRSGRSELYREALRVAFADAKAKAQALAEEADAGLGQVQRIHESGADAGPVYPMALRADASSSTPVEPGRLEVQAGVTVTFALA
jgi:uncharacterized protein YggE